LTAWPSPERVVATSLCQSVGRYPPPHRIWSLEIVVLNGVTTTVKVAHVRLCYSRMMFARAYPRETQEMVFDAHERPSRFSGAPAGAASTTT
jgi:hypothetical protein